MPNSKILLINPPTPQYNMKLFPPLNLITIASHIPENYEVKLIDNNFEKLEYDADLVCISANTYSIRRAYNISNKYRKKGIPVIIGGNHPTILPEEAKSFSDSVVIGDGEPIWNELLKDYHNGNLKKYYKSRFFNFEEAKIPRRDLLRRSYSFDSLETVRGCPFDCDFCSVTRFHGRTYRFKPLKNIEKEVESLQKNRIFIVDDNIIGYGGKAEERTIDLFKLLIEYDLKWMGQASINLADNEKILSLASKSGCIFLFIGFESIQREALRYFNKKLNLKRGITSYRDIIQCLHDYGIGIMGSFIIGTDFDTKESLSQLKTYIKELEVDIPNFTHLTPYPGTKVYEKLLNEQRLINEKFWLKDPFPVFTFKPKNLTLEELYEHSMDLIKSFNKIIPASFRSFKSLIKRKSMRKSIYILAESLNIGKVLNKELNNYQKFYF